MSDLSESTSADGDVYHVWSNEHRGWWREGGWGYTRGLSEAGRFTRANALRVCRDAIPTAGQLGTVSEIPVRRIDMDAFLRGQVIPSCIMTGVD